MHEIIQANKIIAFFYYHLSQITEFTIAQQCKNLVVYVGFSGQNQSCIG